MNDDSDSTELMAGTGSEMSSFTFGHNPREYLQYLTKDVMLAMKALKVDKCHETENAAAEIEIVKSAEELHMWFIARACFVNFLGFSEYSLMICDCKKNL